MKFKNIKSFSHNFSHSYVSFENYVDGEFVFKDLKELVYSVPNNAISIYWIYPENQVLPLFNERINKSIEYYMQWLPTHLSRHNLEKAFIEELRTDIYLASNRQLMVRAYARDVNGKEYLKNIYAFADLTNVHST